MSGLRFCPELELGQLILEDLGCERLIVLNSDQCFRNAEVLHDQHDPLDNLIRMFGTLAEVSRDVRLAFSGIDHEELCCLTFRYPEFHVSRESGSTQTDQAGIAQGFEETFRVSDNWWDNRFVAGVLAIGFDQDNLDGSSGTGYFLRT